jgi:hypothetical protein
MEEIYCSFRTTRLYIPEDVYFIVAEVIISNLVFIHFFLILVCEATGTAVTCGLLCQPRVIVKMIVEKQMECRLAGKPKLSEKTCPSATFVHYKIPHDQTRV